jgi:hypothetical protein
LKIDFGEVWYSNAIEWFWFYKKRKTMLLKPILHLRAQMKFWLYVLCFTVSVQLE